MVRTYKKKNLESKYSEDDMARALLAVNEGISFGKAAMTYNVSKTTLIRQYKGQVQSPQKFGHKLALLKSEEFAIAQNLAALGDFGMAFDHEQPRDFIKMYLDDYGRCISVFKDNRPGPDWVYGFLGRHKHFLSTRMCQNISRKRAAVSETMVSDYFKNLQESLEGVPPANIINYDETNLTDDPKGKLQIFRRGTKHAERIINTTKSSISLMFAVTASGRSLIPYVVYNAEHIQKSWMEGGPVDVEYKSNSGWFDANIFIDWFHKVILKYVRTLPSDEPKVLIGDNLASHINHKLVPLCEKHNIRMVFLTHNSTHLLQPLDVAIYGPLKKHWREVLTAWKLGAGAFHTTLPKWIFPSLLLQLLERVEPQWEHLAKAGFKSCGIYPFNPEHVLAKVRRDPTDQQQEVSQPSTAAVPSENKRKHLHSSTSSWSWWTSECDTRTIHFSTRFDGS
ncbi:uncharacterized protein LOC143022735 [Oratosquilla oratoria]|uniref:uncharacterized protein LOC143022735 n=1 Tax=Oratosquilla oratoria TaxID=337810 RepID=UPI003F764F04